GEVGDVGGVLDVLELERGGGIRIAAGESDRAGEGHGDRPHFRPLGGAVVDQYPGDRGRRGRRRLGQHDVVVAHAAEVADREVLRANGNRCPIDQTGKPAADRRTAVVHQDIERGGGRRIETVANRHGQGG